LPVVLRARVGDVPDRALVTEFPEATSWVKELLSDVKELPHVRGVGFAKGTYGGVEVAVVSHGYGGPSASIIVEELSMLGVEYVVRLGEGASLGRGLGLGDVVVASSASYRSGSLYRQYLREDICVSASADHVVLRYVDEALTGKGVKHLVSPIVTIDSYHSIVKGNAARLSQIGAAVDLETAAVYVVSLLRGLRTVSVDVITRSLTTGEAVEDGALRTLFRGVGEALLEALSSLPRG